MTQHRTRRQKNYLSVLPLESWMRWMIDEDDGYVAAGGDRFVPMSPVLNRDGWYRCRLRKLEWFEYRGKAFQLPPNNQMFQYCVSLADAKVLTTREVEAYREVLRLGAPRHIRKDIQNILYVDSQIKELRQIRLGGFRQQLHEERHIK